MAGTQTLHARIRFAPSSVECRPWHLLTWPESAHCLLGHLHWRPWPAKHVRRYNRAYNCEWMSGTVHINWIMFLGTCFHWQKVFIILRCRKLLKIALDLRWSVWFLGSQGAWKPEHAVWICAEQVMESTCLQEKSKIFWAETHAICQRTLEVFKCWKISNRTSRVAKCLASDFDRNILPETCIFQNGHNTNMTNPVLVIFKNRYHRTGPLRSSPLRVLYLVLKLRHIHLQKVSFVSSLMQSMLFTVFLVQGQRETPGLAPPMQWALKRVEHAPSATGILVHVPLGWPCLLVQCRMSCYVAPHALFT